MTNLLEIIKTLSDINYGPKAINIGQRIEIDQCIDDLKQLRTQLIKMQEEVCTLPIDWNGISLGDVDPLNSIDDLFEEILYEEKTNDPG